mgnify:CR=1 FL=1
MTSKMDRKSKNSISVGASCGFTIIETLIVIGIFAIVASAALATFHSSQNRRELTDAQATIYRTLERQRNKALTGVDTTNHGVHIEPDRIITFSGDSYGGSGNEILLPLSTDTDQAGTDVVFKRISSIPTTAALLITITHDCVNSAGVSFNADGLIFRE